MLTSLKRARKQKMVRLAFGNSSFKNLNKSDVFNGDRHGARRLGRQQSDDAEALADDINHPEPQRKQFTEPKQPCKSHQAQCDKIDITLSRRHDRHQLNEFDRKELGLCPNNGIAPIPVIN